MSRVFDKSNKKVIVTVIFIESTAPSY